MESLDVKFLGRNLELARRAAGLTQAGLAATAKLNRVQVVRMEAGQTVPRLDEAVRLAEALQVPLEWLIAGRWTPTNDLRGIALELYRLGIRDLVVSDSQVPGSFRHDEEVLVLAVCGDRPEPRVVEAIPFLLARRDFHGPLAAAFADVHDPRARARLAWLSEIALAFSRSSKMPLAIESTPACLHSLIALGEKGAKPDSLGHPRTGPSPPIWRRWNITYAGTVDDFLRRTMEVAEAFRSSRFVMDEL